jgi:glutathione-specific gamma-glutamylcyclotransferase
MTELWVFGYGSLIWRPGFPYLERKVARLIGVHRSLCVYSWVHRGTPERPGLVLGLDRGGACRGIAFRIAPEDWESVHAYLREREQVTAVYLERMREMRFADGSVARGLTYLVDRSHGQYAGKLDEDTQFRIVAEAHGRSGANSDYVVNTAAHLAELGMPDPLLARLAERLRALDPHGGSLRRQGAGKEPPPAVDRR